MMFQKSILWASFGMWRLNCLALYLAHPDYPLVDSKYGWFRCPDFASLYQFWPWWEGGVRKEVKACDGLFVDVGANMGFYSVMAAKQGCRVVALEPGVKAWSCLVDNIHANGVSTSVDAFPVAAWSESATVNFKQGRHTDVSRIEPGEGPTVALPLDIILHGRRPDLVKIDSEGSEANVLQGMVRTMQEFHPNIIFETWNETSLQKCMPYLKDYNLAKLDRVNYLAS